MRGAGVEVRAGATCCDRASRFWSMAVNGGGRKDPPPIDPAVDVVGDACLGAGDARPGADIPMEN
eukprot:7567554-Lingulodinium_polyedra.AAC.1